MDPDIDEYEIEELPKAKTIRQKIFYLFEHPQTSKQAFGLSLFILSVILLSTVTFIIGSLPEFWIESPKALQGLEIFAISVFTTEYLIRLVCSPVWWRWMTSKFI